MKWVQVPDSFPLPKGVNPGTWLLLTQQATKTVDALKSRKGQSGVSQNMIILSGPSGIGKSCLTLLAAIHMRIEEKENVLYVPDAGELLAIARRDAEQHQCSVSVTLVALLFQLARQQNSKELMDEIFSGDDSALSMDGLVGKLNDNDFIVFLDEQGHAYTELEKRSDHYTFGMIYPNFYITRGSRLRVVLTGSNQASFETSLNGEYQTCLKYVQPMMETEAAAFNERCCLGLTEDDIRFYCNCIPREMRMLSKALTLGTTRENHLKNRAVDMQQALVRTFEEKHTSPLAISAMVTYLFRDKSLGHHGSTLAPFLDLGFVYRSRTKDGLIEAYPLCLAAETALIGLWKVAGLPSFLNLQECIKTSNGADFETLVFHTLVLKYSHEYKVLQCTRLGYFAGVENYSLKIDTVYTSSLHSNASDQVAGEIKSVHAVAKKRGLTVLYKCPRGTESVDFCVLSPHCMLAIQVSLQSLTSHREPNAVFLRSIGAFTPKPETRGHEWRYIHVTTSPEPHPVIALYSQWNGVDVNKIRLVDANMWLRV